MVKILPQQNENETLPFSNYQYRLCPKRVLKLMPVLASNKSYGRIAWKFEETRNGLVRMCFISIICQMYSFERRVIGTFFTITQFDVFLNHFPVLFNISFVGEFFYKNTPIFSYFRQRIRLDLSSFETFNNNILHIMIKNQPLICATRLVSNRINEYWLQFHQCFLPLPDRNLRHEE